MHADDYGPVTARFYDAAYATLPGLGADVGFYRSLAREAGGPVLELGCGTGRVLAALAEDGHACTGLDASPEMLAVARRRLPVSVELHVADMRDFALPGRCFALVCSAFRAFQHLACVEDQLRCLARVREHLAPGGCFAFDVFCPDPGRLAQDEESEAEDLRFEQEGQLVVRYARIFRDLPTQSMRVHFRYERREGERVVGEDRAAFTMRWFHRYELEHLVARAGFRDVEIHGGFDRRPVAHDSRDLVVVAR